VAHYCQVKDYADKDGAQRHYRRLVPKNTGEKEIPDDFPYENLAAAINRCRLKGVPEEALGSLPPFPGSGMTHLVRALGLTQ